MTDTYRLVFRGEVVEGQHPAVVRKRLAMALNLVDARVQSLFTGNPVVIRKSVDQETAARFQAVFKKAGAKLRVQLIAVEGSTTSETSPGSTTKTSTETIPSGRGPEEWVVLPVGSYVLEPDERAPFVPRAIDTSHFALVKMKAFAAAEVEREKREIKAPVFEVLPVGSRIGAESTVIPPAPPAVEFEVAEVGATLGSQVETSNVRFPASPAFDLAEPGALIEDTPRRPAPKAPDTSHLSVIDNQ